MAHDPIASPGTVFTVHSQGRCAFCAAELPPARNHNKIPRRFCSGSRCRSAWHIRERRRTVQTIADALAAVSGQVDRLLKRVR